MEAAATAFSRCRDLHEASLTRVWMAALDQEDACIWLFLVNLKQKGKRLRSGEQRLTTTSTGVVAGDRLREKDILLVSAFTMICAIGVISFNDTLPVTVSASQISPSLRQGYLFPAMRSNARWGREGATRASVLCWSMRPVNRRLPKCGAHSPTRRPSRHSLTQTRRDNGSGSVPTVHAHDAP